MSDSYSIAPIWFTDVLVSGVMVVLALGSVIYALRLARLQRSNVIWTYLLWLSVALAGFCVSRSVGHIAQRLLLLFGMSEIWVTLRPISGAFNTLTFVVVASITLFFQRVQEINTAVIKDKQALEQAGREVMRLNRDLESLVRQRTEQLSASEKKYRRIFEGSMDMIFILDEKGVFLDINEAGLTTLGYDSPAAVIGKIDLWGLFLSQDAYGELMRDLQSHGFVRDRECRLRARTGSGLFLLLSAACRRDDAGQLVSYEGNAKDITARKQMERQFQRAEKLASLGQIATGIAHEINNPLGVMLGYTQLLLRENKPGSQVHDDLKTIEKHARNCKSIVDDLLKFARSTSTRKAPVDVNQCMTEVISLLAHQFELDKINLETHFAADLPLIVADDEKLKQVIMNLLMNARQAISQTGVIAVSTDNQPDAGRIRVTISDNGCGMPAEITDRIFDPFFTTKPVGQGTGLGLSVSYGIIQDHNGRIEVDSDPGHGSTFTILLPTKSHATSDDRDPARNAKFSP